MLSRLAPIGFCALILVLIFVVGGCERPKPESDPSATSMEQTDGPPTTTAPDSGLADSLTAALDRFKAARSPSSDDSLALRRWADAAQTSGDSLQSANPNRAREVLEPALQAYRTLGDSARLAKTLGRLGQTYEDRSEYSEALSLYKRALPISRTVGDRGQVATLLHGIGDVHRNQGRYEEALGAYEEALSIRRALGRRQEIAKTLNNLGLAYEYQGDFENALDCYRESLALKRDLGDRPGMASTLNNMGIAHAIQGRYEKALSRWEASLEIKRDLGDRQGIANTLNNIANIYDDQGQAKKALVRFQESLSILRDLGDREGTASVLNNIGLIHERQGRYEDALSHFQNSLTLKRDLGDRRGIARTLSNIGSIQQKRGRFEEALSRHRAALAIKREIGDRRGIATSLADIGVVYESRGREEAALRQYRQALQINRDIGNRAATARTLQHLGELHLRRGHLPAAVDTLDRAVRLADTLRLSATSPEARRSLLSTQIDAYRALTTAHVRAGESHSALQSLERGRARLLADRLAGAATGDTAFAVPSWADLRRGVGADEAVLLYANAEGEWPLSIIVATADTVYARERPASTLQASIGREYEAQLRRLRRTEGPLTAALDRGGSSPRTAEPSLAETVRLYRSYLTRDESDPSIRRDLGRRLHTVLVEPVEDVLQAKETLTVVPTGVLGYMPFEALRTSEGAYLIEEKQVRYAQSMTVLRQLQERTYEARERSLLAIGGAAYGGPSSDAERPLLAEARSDSDVGSEEEASALYRSAKRRMERGESPRSTYSRLGYGQWSALYGSELEVRKLRRAMGKGATLLTGPDASEERVRQMSESGDLSTYQYLHFATHGIAMPEAPSLSALVLSQVGASDSLAVRDGYLTMSEIADLEMQADVAVLSACRTGLGRIVAGEGVVGLSHAFLRAGANATLVSQWRVLDWSTQQFMTATYRRAQAEDVSFAEATAQVKREFIDGTFGERNADPLRWAPFVYYGRE